MAYTLQFMPQVQLREEGSDLVLSREHGSGLRLANPGGAFRALMLNLARGDMDRDALCETAHAHAEGPEVDLARLYFAVMQMERKGFIRYTACHEGRAIATLEPAAPAFRFDESPGDGPFLLSRFACLRREKDTLVVESPLGHARIVLRDGRAAALVALLAAPHTPGELAARVSGFDADSIAAFLGLLGNARAAFSCAQDGRIPEDDSVALRQWEFHDLLFHTRTRVGRHSYPYGGTFRFRDTLPSLPALKPATGARRVALPRPDLHGTDAARTPFSAVTEARCSIRSRGEQPLDVAQLGEFLYRVGRVKAVHPESREQRRLYESTSRPAAGGGAVHEIDLYVTPSRCSGIEPALYRYDPLAHELEHVADFGAKQQRLLDDARRATGLETPPDVLVTLAARFQRMAWKYESMAYATILKNAGVLYEQMYLVATAMGLAPCGLGGGDSDLFAEAAGLDYYVESSVGEFMLSSR